MSDSPVLAERLARLSPAQRELLLRKLAAQKPAAAETVARRTPPGTPLPLTSAQQRIWLFEKLTPGTGAYHVYGHYRLAGALDVAALERAFAEIVRRHEALRVSFFETDGVPQQIVAADVAFAIERMDLTALPRDEREDAARRRADAETERPFDLARAPLLRVALVKLADDDHLLLVVVHHIVADAWSRGVIYGELAPLYRAYANGEASPLPEPRAQLSDAVLFQRDVGYERRVATQLEFWREALDGVQAVLDLPTDRPRASVPGGRGARHSLKIPRDVVDGVAQLARGEGATPFMALLAAFQALLARWSGQDEVVVGSPVANRDPAEFEDAVGLFVNTLALRGNLGGDPSFRELLARTRAHVFGALDNAHAPLERVVDQLALERVPGRAPLFQVMFVLQNADGDAPPLPGLAATWLEPDAQTSRFEITLSLGGGGTEGVLDYDPDLFDAATIARLAAQYEALLRAAVATPDLALSRLPLLDDVARAELLALGDGGRAIAGAERCLHELLPAAAARAPDADALVEAGRTLSWRELHERVNGLAHALRGPRVAVLADRSAEALIAVLAALAAGAAYVPLDPGSPDERLRALLADCGAATLVAPPALLDKARAIAGDVPVIASDSARPLRDAPLVAIDDRAPAYVIYTSGSTGKPKGVVVPHRGAMNLVRGFVARHEFAGQRLLMIPPLIFDASVGDVFPAIAAGAALVLHPAPAELGAAELERFCDEHRVTAIDAPAALWRRWSEALARGPRGRDVLPGLRLMMIGGESVPVPEVRRFARATGGRVALSNHYGPTEASVCATMLTTRDAREIAASELPIGTPLPGVRLYVLDAHGALAPRGVAGELAIGGAGVADGYLDAPTLTAERFVRDPFAHRPHARMYRTGDLVRWNADGTLQFIGRRDQQAKLRGFRIELGEVEAALASCPDVRAAVAAVREDRPGDKRLVAYVVADPALADDALRAHLAALLPDAMLPSQFVRLDALPLTPNGKVDRKALPAPAAPARDARTLRAPSTPTERAVLAVWRELLARDDLGVDEDFFALGGDSLATLPLVFKLEAAVGVAVPLSAVFATPTIAGLSRTIDELRSGHGGAALDLHAKAVLDDDIDPRGAAPARATPRSVLLTGATGFLGAYLMRELIDTTALEVVCLVRAESDADALRRIHDNLARYGLACDASRVAVCRGDLAAPLLGLDEPAFAALAERVDLVIHNGGQVHFLAPYETHEAANVGGTREVLRLASRTRVKPVHFVSTLGVFVTGSWLDATVRESDLPLAEEQGGGYNESKWVAERLALAARARGLPVAIHRPARVMGDATTGAGNPDDYMNAWIRGCAQLGLAPRLPGEAFDMAPVDHVARAIVRLALGAGDRNGDFHLFNARRRPVAEAVAEMRACGVALEEVPYATWRAALLESVARSRDNALAPFAGLFPEDPDPRAPRFDTRATDAALAAAGVAWPPADRALFRTYLDFLRSRGLLPTTKEHDT